MTMLLKITIILLTGNVYIDIVVPSKVKGVLYSTGRIAGAVAGEGDRWRNAGDIRICPEDWLCWIAPDVSRAAASAKKSN